MRNAITIWCAETFGDWLINRALRSPYSHLPGYMNRFWLLPYSRWRPAVRIHQILRSDADRAFHDHPWRFISIILRGGYLECRPVYDKSGLLHGYQRKWHDVGSVLMRGAKDLHRLDLMRENGKYIEAWSLFITFGKRQTWGFVPNLSWKIPHYDYDDASTDKPKKRQRVA